MEEQASSAVILKVQKIDENAKLPFYAYPGDAGLDIYSAEELLIPAGEVRAIRTGVRVAMPDAYFGLMKGKTGLALNFQLCTVAEVVDPNYRGELRAILLNFGEKPYLVRKSQKIAQLVIVGKNDVIIQEVEELDATERGERGFGSSCRIYSFFMAQIFYAKVWNC